MRIGVYVINLDRDAGRLEFMRRQIDAAGLEFTRFPAVLGTAVPAELAPWFRNPDGTAVAWLKPGEIGVYASHIGIHRLLLDTDLDAALVFEDDVRLSPDLSTFLATVDTLPRNWDIVRLSNPSKAAFAVFAQLAPGLDLVGYARVPNNLGCYLISRSGAAKTTRFRGVRTWAIDEDMRRPWDWDLMTYGVLPAPTEANVLDTSSIDSLGARTLGRETWWAKLKRRRWLTPAAIIRRIGWQIRFFGLGTWLRCLATGFAARLRRALSAQARKLPRETLYRVDARR